MDHNTVENVIITISMRANIKKPSLLFNYRQFLTHFGKCGYGFI
jgi:hypothetical protein